VAVNIRESFFNDPQLFPLELTIVVQGCTCAVEFAMPRKLSQAHS
jgi:hypothetical protein